MRRGCSSRSGLRVLLPRRCRHIVNIIGGVVGDQNPMCFVKGLHLLFGNGAKALIGLEAVRMPNPDKVTIRLADFVFRCAVVEPKNFVRFFTSHELPQRPQGILEKGRTV
jgi:hypothetical protein